MDQSAAERQADEYSANEIAIAAQQRTIASMVDTLFANSMKPRRQMIDDCIGAAFRLKSMIEDLIRTGGDDNYGSLAESKELAGSIMLNLGNWKAENTKPCVPHSARCQCDDCVSARSDGHFDRSGAR